MRNDPRHANADARSSEDDASIAFALWGAGDHPLPVRGKITKIRSPKFDLT